MLENYSIGMQLLIVSGGLLVLFLLVRMNNKNNRKKRLKNRNFGERIRETKVKKWNADSSTNPDDTK